LCAVVARVWLADPHNPVRNWTFLGAHGWRTIWGGPLRSIKSRAAQVMDDRKALSQPEHCVYCNSRWRNVIHQVIV
jgi:hypothetical protein